MKMRWSIVAAIGVWGVAFCCAAYCALNVSSESCLRDTVSFSGGQNVDLKLKSGWASFSGDRSFGDPVIRAVFYCRDEAPIEVSVRFWVGGELVPGGGVVDGGATPGFDAIGAAYSVMRLYWIELPRGLAESNAFVCCELRVGDDVLRMRVLV